MDGSRFDDLSRQLAATPSRRQFVKALAGGALAVLVSRVGWRGAGAQVPIARCPRALTECSGSCVVTASDPNHCGRCGNRCGVNQVCVSGICRTTRGVSDTVGTCPVGQERCRGVCFPPCGPNQIRDAATCSCVPGCPSGFTLCGGRCVELTSDSNHCGACDNSCISDTICIDGECLPCPGELCISPGGQLCCPDGFCRQALGMADCVTCDRCPADATCGAAGCTCPDGRPACMTSYDRAEFTCCTEGTRCNVFDGTCDPVQCVEQGHLCNPELEDSQCCTGLPCEQNPFDHQWYCPFVLCRQPGQPCNAGIPCCSGTCDNGFCSATCAEAGQGCANDADCCAGNFCTSRNPHAPIPHVCEPCESGWAEDAVCCDACPMEWRQGPCKHGSDLDGSESASMRIAVEVCRETETGAVMCRTSCPYWQSAYTCGTSQSAPGFQGRSTCCTPGVDCPGWCSGQGPDDDQHDPGYANNPCPEGVNWACAPFVCPETWV